MWFEVVVVVVSHIDDLVLCTALYCAILCYTSSTEIEIMNYGSPSLLLLTLPSSLSVRAVVTKNYSEVTDVYRPHRQT